MNILLTSASAPLAQMLAQTLQERHTIRFTERTPVPGLSHVAVSPLGSDFSTNLLVRGVDAIVHVAQPSAGENDEQAIDYLTRCTYNLCVAAAAEGVKRLIYLNTLDVMTAYEPEYMVGEFWRPRPTTSGPMLAKHLGETTCREFAREVQLTAVSLRLGTIVPCEEADMTAAHPMWLDPRDAVQAVERALTADLPRRWSVFHIQHKSPAARFPILWAEEQLQFVPQYNEPHSNKRAADGGMQ